MRGGLFKCQRRSIKQFSPLWCPCEVGASLFMSGKDLIHSFNLRGGAVKCVEVCLSAREDRESSFHRCGCPVRLLQATLCVVKT